MKIVASVLLAFTAFALFAGARSDDDGVIQERDDVVGGFVKHGEVCSVRPNSDVAWFDSDGILCRCCEETGQVSCGEKCQKWFKRFGRG